MKGCTNEDQEDGSMKRRTFDIKLYWVRNEKITGIFILLMDYFLKILNC